ncbi:MAG: pyrimidine-nucleoside phosphorylase [Chloroflexi bacterium RBG_16_54_18]|nr:MAG: pyrimidine-nucleoside phosphorylase [Chloroflexi bacterium RBG_16_54_18]
MRAVDIITRKCNRNELTKEEIDFFINGFTRGDIPDYQASAWAMAIMLLGMSMRETTDLTLAMANSGEILDLSSVVPIAVDKHSTGGVGDKTTLVVEPTVAACGLPVAKMSGRGLGFSGGTLDKIESIPGFRTDLSIAEFMQQLREVGLVLAGQSDRLAPADGRLYALRDVTGTVQSIPLIASSIISKKIAAGAQAFVLDVKVGLGAFMKNLEDARTLAETMVKIAHLSQRRAVALLSDMNQPLGLAVGNALEVKEAIETLKGNGPGDFREHCLMIAAYMLVMGKLTSDIEEARRMAESALMDGRALDRFRALVSAQGGDTRCVDDPGRLPGANSIETLTSTRAGFLKEIHAQKVGETAVLLGAGREKKGDIIDPAVGIELHHKVGDYVSKGDPLFRIHINDASLLSGASQKLLEALQWSDQPVEPLPLFYGVVQDEDESLKP